MLPHHNVSFSSMRLHRWACERGTDAIQQWTQTQFGIARGTYLKDPLEAQNAWGKGCGEHDAQIRATRKERMHLDEPQQEGNQKRRGDER